MANHIYSISLDSKSAQIWESIKGSRSQWVRLMLSRHALENAVEIEHQGVPRIQHGLFEKDARCNLQRQGMPCSTCWNYRQLKLWGESHRWYVQDEAALYAEKGHAYFEAQGWLGRRQPPTKWEQFIPYAIELED